MNRRSFIHWKLRSGFEARSMCIDVEIITPPWVCNIRHELHRYTNVRNKTMKSILAKCQSVPLATNKTMEEAIDDALIEKLRIGSFKPQEGVETLRSIAGKIHGRVTSPDRRTRERILEKLWRKNLNIIEIFVRILESCKDHIVNCSIAGILHECISPRIGKTKSKGCKNRNTIRNNSKLAVSQLINLGGTQVLIRLLGALQHREAIVTEVLMHEIVWILGQVSQKDQKFSTKVRLLNGTKMFHSLLKLNYNHGKMLFPLLLMIKSLAKNSLTLQVLVKDGIVYTLEKTFVCVGYSPHIKLRILLECFKHFTVSKLCCTKFVRIGLVNLLMRMFERWERFDGPNRLKISSYCLNTLQHICVISKSQATIFIEFFIFVRARVFCHFHGYTESGRKAIKANGGLQLLHRFCTNCPEDKPYDCLLSRVCGILNQCLEKKELPVPEMSPVRFVLPEPKVRITNSVESESDADSQMNSVASLGRLCSDIGSCDDDDDDDDDESEDNSCKPRRKQINNRPDENEESKFFADVTSSQRSEEDLVAYKSFFREFGSLQVQLTASAGTAPEASNESSGDSPGNLIPKSSKMKTNLAEGPGKTVENGSNKSGQAGVVDGLKTFENMSPHVSEQHAYCTVASTVKSVITFLKVAYPDLVGGCGLGKAAPLNGKDRKVCRSKLLTCVDRGLHPGTLMQETCYDFDQVAVSFSVQSGVGAPQRLLCNRDEKRVGKRSSESKQLQFESRFESGNLRKAVQIGSSEYDLILTPDVNGISRHQWFYFEVSNMESNVPYTFNIINCEKANSQFNFGMQPILFSVKEAQLGRAGWVRTGTDICYYRNCYRRPGKEKNYYTTSFTVTFQHSYDVCYLAYHFPYTYSQLMANIWRWSRKLQSSSIYFRAESLCDTLNGNQNPLLTITAPDSKSNPIQKRKIIFLSSRVHPGESNASWVMHGTLEALIGNSIYANSLRDDYVFKVVPMLNIEGVVNGCNRHGLTNEDLNRRWSDPHPVLHPVIFHTKGLMEYCTRVIRNPPQVFVDYHGHSRRKNVFLFGCSQSGSWSAADRAKTDDPVQYLMLPHLMQKTCSAFALPLCSFKVERSKESTARVAVWRQLGVSRSYTMESSFCGCDQGALAGFHLDTEHLKEIGRDFCQALSMMKEAGEGWTVDKMSTGSKDGGREQRCVADEITSSFDSDESDRFDD
ncbi:cytosolic carboxypeptidase 1-like isoform X2 [Athalia rosae]|uniref:cytosolic carboxypeptidase 1-like isoform X2 n=1 Tax=Athalia rosae TaxID=37344 RepID=UPI00203352C5|nr:cytosolic carboxypeptidase 1-like isoform X2 [Athalia rosae]